MHKYSPVYQEFTYGSRWSYDNMKYDQIIKLYNLNN